MRQSLPFVAATLMLAPFQAQAGDQPLYQPSPTWVTVAPMPDGKQLAASPPFVRLDLQRRVEGDRLWIYKEQATRVATQEMLSQVATITVPWSPDKGDFIVHELSIFRDGKPIDLIAGGQKFTVLRREQTLEQRELTGILTATMAVEGLQVGDVLRMRSSQTVKDAALAGNVQGGTPVPAMPMPMGSGQLILSWPKDRAIKWKALAEGAVSPPSEKDGFSYVTIKLPLVKQTEMPMDAPARYRRGPMVELSSFESWSDVAKVFAPLYKTDGLITPGGPIAAEIDAIMKAEASPRGRAQRALELVQDKIRYLAVGMDGGNYVPQSPAKTWDVRYGDCKAKTVLLLAMLHAMKIEAEPVLAHIGLGDMVPDRLPSAAAFNHVLVRAVIDGKSLWMDGTGTGDRLADIEDTPPLRYVLPVRTAGAELIDIIPHAKAVPDLDISFDVDESTSSDLPSIFQANARFRGSIANQLTMAKAQLEPKELRKMVSTILAPFVGVAQYDKTDVTVDPVSGTATISAHGVTTTTWTNTDRKRKRTVGLVTNRVNFAPDRARPAWAKIPVRTGVPGGYRYRLTLRLPDGGKGHIMEGEAALKQVAAASQVTRAASVVSGVLTLEETLANSGAEIAADRIATERAAVALLKSKTLKVVAPETTLRRWELGAGTLAKSSQVKAIETVFAAAIAEEKETTTALTSRASFRAGIGDQRGALSDISAAIAIDPNGPLYLLRSSYAFETGDAKLALADAQAARGLDPSSFAANERAAWLLAESGKLSDGLALLDEQINLGGEKSFDYRESKASLVGEFGDPSEALKLLDELIAEKPGSPSLLNGRCWVKGTRAVQLDSGLKDCTSAIELSSDATNILDSRAMVWFKQAKFEEALRDLDLVKANNPGLAQSRFLRANVLKALNRKAEADADIAIARRLTPSVDRTYARFGVRY